MKNLIIEYIDGDELPHSVTLNRDGGNIYGSGTTLEGALLRMISLVETKHKWTNVNDGLPEWEQEWKAGEMVRKITPIVDGWVIPLLTTESLEDGYRIEVFYVECSKHPEVTGWYHAHDEDFDNKMEKDEEVTHWILCPAPPKRRMIRQEM